MERREGAFSIEIIEIKPLSAGDRELAEELRDALALFGGKVENETIQAAAVASNAKTAHASAAELAALASRWAKSEDTAPMVKDLLAAPCSDILRKFRETSPQFSLMLVMDRAGIVVCATERTADYCFATAHWWKRMAEGRDPDGAMGSPVASPTGDRERQTPILVPVIDPQTGDKLGVGLALVGAALM